MKHDLIGAFRKFLLYGDAPGDEDSVEKLYGICTYRLPDVDIEASVEASLARLREILSNRPS